VAQGADWVRIKSPKSWFKANVPELAATTAWHLTSPAGERLELDTAIGTSQWPNAIEHDIYTMPLALQNLPWVLHNSTTNRQVEVVLGTRDNGGSALKAPKASKAARTESLDQGLTQDVMHAFMQPWLEAIEWKREAIEYDS
jgi:hypothetical protein